ncbi:GNAT family N-acetyltransferase [Halobacillus sp. BBL2006]|uniref:GNAT family N-acetyltransferase n=1 Tax=Halobacillus sp. BBL2006 TaxID=1543706 RepID=UPI0005443D75|nr:GNAT family N-acetyltransferase [Halobacillus sp. BBL2006]KHE72076.1 hypothetical protein LD39_06490 [Halobacillus sp. BBL2006]
MEHTIQEERGRFYIGEQSSPVAFLAFDEEGDTMIITSTVVEPSARNQGLATELVDHAVNYARKNKLQIDPECPFARDVIKDTPEYHVVWKK